MTRSLIVLGVLLLAAVPAGAQVVERPIPFDSAGRVMVITPHAAAQMELLPPVWQITGDFREARLYETGPGAYVLVVTRPNGAIERYPMTAGDVAYLRARAGSLPPPLAEEIRTSSGVRREFIRNQALLGLAVYGPSFAGAVTNDDAGRLATYLLIAGGSYFAAASLSREIQITGPQNSLATHMAIRGGAMGLAVTYAADAGHDGQSAGVFAGSLLGTAGGLWIGRRLTGGEARTMGFGADVAALTTLGLLYLDGDVFEPEFSRPHALALAGAGAAGYGAGLMYARTASYNITSGDITVLWISGAIGSLAAATAIVDGDHDIQTVVPVLTGGFLAGVVAGDRLLVSRFDHSVGEGALIAVGAGAGALMGMGVGVLIDRDNETLTFALGGIGAAAGVAATERLFPPSGDAGRTASRIRFHPAGVALAAARVPGRLPILSVGF